MPRKYTRRYKRKYRRRLHYSSLAAYRRKKMYKSLIKGKMAIHTYRRVAEIQTVNVATDTNVNLGFNLGLLPNVSEFTQLYDQYKIKKIVLRIERPFTQNELLSDTGVLPVGNLITTNKFIRVVHDYDGGAALTAENQYFEYQNMKSYPAVGTKAIRITLYPKMLDTVYRNDSVNSQAAAVINPVWCDVSNTDIKHYGLKMFFPQIAPAGNNQVHRLFATYIFQLKTPLLTVRL